MAKRKSITKKTRFEIFKRDQFRCYYCGGHPPNVILEVDHIKPVKNGGSNSLSNLVTSCLSCNRGKSSIELDDKLPAIDKNSVEVSSQITGHSEHIDEIRKNREMALGYIEKIFSVKFNGEKFDKEMRISVLRLLHEMTIEEMEYAMLLSVSKVDTSARCMQYFYGVCWKKIRGLNKWPWPTDSVALGAVS